jgi:hypothetical protein
MSKTNPPGKKNKSLPKANPAAEGYPLYSEKDDIYMRAFEDKELDPEDLSRIKPLPKEEDLFEDEYGELDEEHMGSDLDIPGGDLDDDDEDIGNEDEENNYYSLGGDKHHDLEEADETEDDIII